MSFSLSRVKCWILQQCSVTVACTFNSKNRRSETLTESYDCQCENLLYNNSHEAKCQLYFYLIRILNEDCKDFFLCSKLNNDLIYK